MKKLTLEESIDQLFELNETDDKAGTLINTIITQCQSSGELKQLIYKIANKNKLIRSMIENCINGK